MTTKELGDWGENLAQREYRKRHYKIITGEFRTRLGEIDLIAENKEYIVFAEVKLRKNSSFAQAREYVTAAKQNKIRAAASLWLTAHETEKQLRFDVVEIYAPDGMDTKKPEIYILENAF